MPALALALPFITQRPLRSGGGAVLPSGAVGVWYADQYTAGDRPYIPNSISTTSVSSNLLSFPRRRFNDNNYYGKNLMTITDANATDPNGVADEASTIVGTGDCYLFPVAPHPVLTAGTYTMAVSVKRTGGTDQNFTMSFLTAGLTSPTKTATATWQRFSWTGTVGAGSQTMFFLRAVAAAGLNVEICDLALYAGSSDLGEPAPSGHMYLGRNKFQTLPAYASGALDFSNSSMAWLQFPSTVMNTFTIVSVARKKTNVRTYNTILSRASSYGLFAPMYEQANTLKDYYGGIDISSGGLAGACSLHTRGWKIFAHRYDGTNASTYVNNSRILHLGGYFPSAYTMLDLVAGVFQQESNPSDMEVAAWALYPTALTEAQMITAYTALKARVLSSGISLTEDDVYWRAEGDSITSDVNSYCTKYGPNATIKVIGGRSAVAGGLVSGLETRAAALDFAIPNPVGSRRYVLSVLIGANDLTSSMTTGDFLAALASYCDDRRAAGWIVVLCTILPNTNVGFNAKRNVANTEIRLWTAGGSTVPGIHADYICDFAADATMGPDAAASNVTYYSDGVHPTNAGHVILETVLRPVMNSI